MNDRATHQPGSETCVCVAGWALDQALLEQLTAIPEVDVFLLSHRPAEAVSAALRRLLPPERWWHAPNVGYDWGTFQQFFEAGLHRRYRFACFMHDDVTLTDPGLFAAATAALRAGAAVVGNGWNGAPTNHIERGEPWCYAHSSQPPPRARHATVRGSFLAMATADLDAAGGFEVFWDRWRLRVETGNNSLVASCAKFAARFGNERFAYLSNEYCASPYLVEHVRGNKPSALSFRRRCWTGLLLRLYRWAGAAAVNAEMRGGAARLLGPAARRIVRFVAAPPTPNRAQPLPFGAMETT